MTREDINDIINAICPNDEDYEKPCISPKYLRQELEQLALDQKQWNEEPTTKNNLGVDLISRADAIKAMQEKSKKLKNLDTINGLCGAVAILYDMPSVTPQEPQTFEWCTDCKEYDQEKHCCHRWSKVIRDTVEDMKQEQEPKTGHWIPTYGNVKCSVCGSVKDSREVGKATHYCDFCGAKMEGEK